MTMIGNNFPVRANAFCLSSEKRAISAQMSPAGTLCFDIFSPLPDDSEVISQIERLSSNETKIAPRSLRMALGASGRSAVTCMAVSRVGVRNLTLPERRSLSTSPWDLERASTAGGRLCLCGRTGQEGGRGATRRLRRRTASRRLCRLHVACGRQEERGENPSGVLSRSRAQKLRRCPQDDELAVRQGGHRAHCGRLCD